MFKVLCIDNSFNRLAVIESFFSEEWDFSSSPGIRAAQEVIENSNFDVILADIESSSSLIKMNTLLSFFKRNKTFVFLSANSEKQKKEIEALHQNNSMIFLLPQTNSLPEIKEFINHILLPRIKKYKKSKLLFNDFVGESPQLLEIKDQILAYGSKNASVLIFGESGTGKEVIARSIHNCSERAAFSFHAVNMAAIPDSIAESELFGNTKGAFTDALPRKGHIQASDKGTLFLDEISCCSLNIQAKLLRVLEERKVIPLGQDESVPFDSRIISATNKPLKSMIEEKSFRTDLFYRLCILTIKVPPLRERKEDILPIINFFANKEGLLNLELMPDAIDKMLNYNWPGNVRELKNCFERAVALSSSQKINASNIIFL